MNMAKVEITEFIVYKKTWNFMSRKIAQITLDEM